MTAFTMTVNELVRQAYETAALIEEDEDLSAAKLNRGVSLLNQIVSQFNAGTGDIVPYYKDLSFNLVAGQATYELSQADDADVDTLPLLDLTNIILVISQQQIPLEIITDQELFNSWQSLTSNGQPWQVFLDNGIDTSSLTFYLPPDQNYACTLRGIFALDIFEANTPITSVPSFYYTYLRYLLAQELAVSYPSAVWTELHQMKLQKAEEAVRAANKLNVQVNNSPAMISSGMYFNNILGGVWP